MGRMRTELFLLAAFRVCRSIAAGMISIAFPYLVLQFLHRTPLMLGLLYTAAAIATAALGLLVGFLADIWGRKKTLILVGLLLPVSAAIVFLSGHLAALFVAVMLGGYSATGSLMGGGVGGAAQPIQSAVIADLTSRDERTLYFSSFSFVSGVFGAAGTLAVRLFSLHAAFLAAALVSLLSVAFVLPLRLHEPRGHWRRLAGKVVIGKFSFTGALNGLSQGLVVPFLIPFFVIVYAVPKSEMAVYGFFAGVLASVTLLAAPRLERRLGFVRSVAFTRGLGAFLLVLMPLWHLFPLALAVYLVTPSLRVAAVPLQQTALTDMVDRDETGRALGMSQVSRLAASSGGIAFTGYMFNVAEIAVPFFAYAGVIAANIYLYFRFFGSYEAASEP
jgi:Na+/melibiose symporter-like transporter